MKKILPVFALVACFISWVNPASAQVCTPDTNYTAPGWYPDPLPNGCVGTPYNEVIHFVFPNDTVLPIIGTVPFDTFKVNTIGNIPAGLSYTCNISNCVYYTSPPAITRGCVLVSGTPTTPNSAPNDSVDISATAYAGGFGIPVTLKIGLHIDAAPCGTSTNPTLASRIGLNAAPNPASDFSRISFNLPGSGFVKVNVFDATGREVASLFEGNMNSGMHQLDMNTNHLPAGIYHVSFQIPAANFRQALKVVKL